MSWAVETYAIRQNGDSWKTNTGLGGGVLNSFVSHTFHYVEWLFGPIERLSAELSALPSRAGAAESLVSMALARGPACPWP